MTEPTKEQIERLRRHTAARMDCECPTTLGALRAAYEERGQRLTLAESAVKHLTAASEERGREVERLKAEQADLRKANLGLGRGLAEQTSKLKSAEAEVERLRAELQKCSDTAVDWRDKEKQAEARLREVVDLARRMAGEIEHVAALVAAQPEEENHGS